MPAKLEAGKRRHRPICRAFSAAWSSLQELSQILGLFRSAGQPKTEDGDDQLVGGLMQLLIDLRAEARKAKNFALGDQIRKRLDRTRRDAGRSARRDGLAQGLTLSPRAGAA